MKFVVSSFAAIVRRAPWAVIIGIFVLTGVFGSLASNVVVATGNEGFAPEGDEIAAADRIAEKFGEDSAGSTLQVIIQDEGGDVITVDGLKAATDTTAAIAGSDLGQYVNETPERPGTFHYMSIVQQAIQMQNIPIDSLTDDLVKQIFIEAINQDGVDDAPIEQVSFITRLISQDFDPVNVTASAGMAIAFVSAPEGATTEDSFNKQAELEAALAEDLTQIDSPFAIRPFSFALLVSGADEFLSEVGRLFGIAFAVIMAILLFVFWIRPDSASSRWASIRRTVADMAITLLTILMAIIWMQGIGYLLLQAGVIDAFSSVTQIVPILMIGLGVDYAIHLTARYREEVGSGKTVDGAMGGAIKSVGIALVLATLTTAIGFLTNVFNPVPALKDFGILSAVGILAAFVLMLTFVPAFRAIADRRAESKGILPVGSLESHGDRLLPKIMEKAALLSEHAAVPTLVIALVLGGLGYYGFTQLDTRFSFTDFLPADSPYVQTLGILEDDFGGGFGEQTQILVEGSDSQPIDGSVHNALVDANQGLVDVPDVSVIETPAGSFANANSPIAVLGQMLQGGPESAPPGILAAAQQVGLGPDMKVAPDADVTPLYQAMLDAAPDQVAKVVYFDGGTLDAVLWDVTTTAGEDVGELRPGLDQAFQPVNDLGASAIPTSQNIIGDVVVKALTSSQTRSLLITVLVAGLVLVINFALENRRWFLGVITIAPVGLVVLWTYGLMYLSGIPFGPITATLSALAIGIGVPFTIHLARRFEEDRRTYDDLDEAMRSTTRHTGGALAGSAFTTMAGFGVLMTSNLVPFKQMGQVTVYAVGLALAASVLVLPSMLALWDRYHRRKGDGISGKDPDVAPT